MCKRNEYEYVTLPVQVDRCLVPLVKTLNQYGIKTLSCCCGHGKMRDGRKEDNMIIISADNVELGLLDDTGEAIGWRPIKDFGKIWAIAFEINKEK